MKFIRKFITKKINNIYFGRPKILKNNEFEVNELSNSFSTFKLLNDNCILSTRQANKKSNNSYLLLKTGEFVRLNLLVIDKFNKKRTYYCTLYKNC